MISPRHVLILECAMSGHHPVYMERIASGFLDGGDLVTVTVLARDVEHACIVRLREKYKELFSILTISDSEYEAAFNSSFGEVGREFQLRGMFARAYQLANRSKAVNYVFFPYLDYCLYAVALLGVPFGKTAWGGVCMRPSFHYALFNVHAPKPKFGKIKEWLFSRLLEMRSLRELFTIDELLKRYISEKNPAQSSRIRYLADPAEVKGPHTRVSARQVLGIPLDAKVVLCFGSVDRRKGLDALLSAMPLTDGGHLLVVGKQSQWAKDLLRSERASELQARQRLHVIDAFVDDDQQQMAFVACDVVWLGYQGHYTMSGVLVLAAICGKYVVSTREGLIGWYTDEYELGESLANMDPETICLALGRAFGRRASGSHVSHILAHRHSWHEFCRWITK